MPEMLSIYSGVCRYLASGRTLRLMCNNAARSFCVLKPEHLGPFANFKDEFLKEQPSINYITKFLNELENHDNIQWHNVLKVLSDMKVSNPSAKILQACIRMKRADFGISYYKYMTGRGKEFSVLDMLFFTKLLGTKKSEIKRHEELLIKLYNNVKGLMLTSPAVKGALIDVFTEIPSCYSDIVASRFCRTTMQGDLHLIKKALELNQEDTAFDYMNDNEFFMTSDVLEAYINFCIRRVEEGKFSVNLINKLVYLCQKHAVTLNDENLLFHLNSLVSVLMKYDKKYSWSVSQCEICEENSICSNCDVRLLPKSVTTKEFNILKESVFKNAFVGKNVFLSSTKDEVMEFSKFLKSAQPYHVVLDGLNLLFRERSSVLSDTSAFQQYFVERGFNVLVIGRSHSRKILTERTFIKKNLKDKIKYFFTANMSDDDLFLIYAALYGGPKTFFVTGDFLSKYSGRLRTEEKNLFLKWQMSHQYILREDSSLTKPLPHSGLSQLTQFPSHGTGKFIWHLSNQPCQKSKIRLGYPIQWYCLQAEIRNKN